MALQLGALRDALIDAGASEEKAQRAAEELAGYQSEFTRVRDEMRGGFAKVDQEFLKVEREFARVRGEMRDGFARVDQEFAKVRGEINLLRWMVGANFALTLAVFVRLFIR